MARKKRTDDGLKGASIVVLYEVAMLANTLGCLLNSRVNKASSPNDQFHVNLLVHSFLLAARNLLKFFFSGSDTRADDLIAEDFFDEAAEWAHRRPEKHAKFQEYMESINKSLPHLTWRRVEVKPIWRPFRVAWELSKCLRVFLQSVSDKRLAEEFREDADEFVIAIEKAVQGFGSLDEFENVPLYDVWEASNFWTNPRRATDDKS